MVGCAWGWRTVLSRDGTSQGGSGRWKGASDWRGLEEWIGAGILRAWLEVAKSEEAPCWPSSCLGVCLPDPTGEKKPESWVIRTPGASRNCRFILLVPRDWTLCPPCCGWQVLREEPTYAIALAFLGSLVQVKPHRGSVASFPYTCASLLRWSRFGSISFLGGVISTQVPFKGSRETGSLGPSSNSLYVLRSPLPTPDPKMSTSFGMCVQTLPSVAWHLGTSCQSDWHKANL